MEIVLLLLVGLTVWALIGHAIWVISATLWRAITGHSQQAKAEQTAKDLDTTRRQLNWLVARGRLDKLTHEKVIEALRQDSAAPSTTERAPETGPAAADVAPPTPRPVAPATTDERATTPPSAGHAPPQPMEPTDESTGPTSPVDASVISEDEPAATAAPPAPPLRARLTKLFAAFMEESNIRWGELTGGLLIVFCSAALVVSLWSQIAQLPIAQVFVFTAISAAIFGGGLYVEHKWRLPMTSRGMLIIATLLVPLNFLMISAYGDALASLDFRVVAVEVAGTVLFAFLLYKASSVYAPGRASQVTASVIGLAAVQLLLRRITGPEMTLPALLAVGAMPLIVYAGVMGWALARGFGRVRMSAGRGRSLLVLLGISSYATAISVGLFVHLADELRTLGMQLSALVSLYGLPSLICGLTFWRSSFGARFLWLRLAGTTAGVLGLVVMGAGIALAWPQPTYLLPPILLTGGVSFLLASRYRVPEAMGLAGCLGLFGYQLTALVLVDPQLNWVVDDARRLLTAMLSGLSGRLLAPATIVLLAASGLMAHRGWRGHARWLLLPAAVAMLGSIVLVGWHGLGRMGDPQWVAAIYGLYGALTLTGAWLLHRRIAAWAGVVLLGVATLQLTVYAQHWQWASGLLMLGTLAALGMASAWWARGRTWALLEAPCTAAMWAGSITATVLLLGNLSPDDLLRTASEFTWVGVLWLLLAGLGTNRLLLTLGQMALSAAVVCAVSGTVDPWQIDVAILQQQAIGLAGFAAAWAGVRLLVPAMPADRRAGDGATTRWQGLRLAPLPAPDWAMLKRRLAGMIRPSGRSIISFDHILTAGLVLFLVGLSWSAIVVFVGHEWVRPSQSFAEAFVQPQAALGGRAWLLLGLLVLTLAFIFRGSGRAVAALIPAGVMLTVSATVPLLAARWMEQFATASALRWWAAGFLLLTASLLWLREPWANRVRAMRNILRDPRQVALLRGLALAITGLPILLLSVLPACRTLLGLEMVGPAPDSLFGRMGAMPAYAVPLACLSLTLVGHAMREQRGGYAYAGGLVGNLTVSLGYLLHLVSIAQPIGEVELVHLLQLNVIWSGLSALAWAGGTMARTQGEAMDTDRVPAGEGVSRWLKAQTGTGLALVLLLLAPALGGLLSRPVADHALLGEAGHWWAWLGCTLTFAAAWLVTRRDGWTRRTHVIASGIITAVSLLTLTVAGLQPAAAYPTLMLALIAAAWAGLIGVLSMQWRVQSQMILRKVAEPAMRWVVVMAVIAAALALRGAWRDLPWHDAAVWWAAGPIVGVAALMLTLAWLGQFSIATLREVIGPPRAYLWAGLVLLNGAATLLWLRDWRPPGASQQIGWTGMLAVQVVALLPTAIMSFVLERESTGDDLNEADMPGKASLPVVHLAAAVLGLACVVMLVLLRVTGPAVEPAVWIVLHGGALLIAGTLAGLCLWDARGVYAPHALGTLLVLAAVLAVDLSRPGTAWLAWLAVVGLGMIGLLGGGVWASRQRWTPYLRRAGVVAQPADPHDWLIAAMTVMALAQTTLLLRIVMGVTAAPLDAGAVAALGWRLSAATGPFLLAGGFACVARGRVAGAVHHAALALGAVGAVLGGWGWTDPNGPYHHLVQHAAVALFALVAVTGIYGFALYRLLRAASPWSHAIRDAMRVLLPAAGVALGATLVLEGVQYLQRDEVLLPMLSVIGVVVALAGAAAVGLFWAVATQHDPLRLTDPQRVGYVYAAEVLVALIFVHLRLTLPWLFAGAFEPYWPLVVMGLAFLGVGLGAWFDRRGMIVLAGPLSRTAMLLPLLPVLGFWMTDPHVHYSGLLLIVGVFYGLMAFNRRSFVLGVIAAVAANGALWYVLHQTGEYSLLDHPQLWLIPIGLSVLVAAYLNRAHLTAMQMGAIRYICLSLVYLSSTAEMFIQGVAAEPWLSLVLAGLSVAGMVAGMLLRVQSLLFTGCGFLVLALLTILYHASTNLGWVWIWYVAGIGLGVLILFLFATFEHRRQRVLQGLDRLRQWEM